MVTSPLCLVALFPELGTGRLIARGDMVLLSGGMGRSRRAVFTWIVIMSWVKGPTVLLKEA